MSHDHIHDHEHDHAHDHGPDCTCGCHGDHAHAEEDAAQALIDGALVLSKTWTHLCQPPVPAAALEAEITASLRRIAALLAEDGVVFGHIKALLRRGEDSVAFSITRLDAVDRIAVGAWPPADPLETWTLTVNILSLANTGAVDAALLEELFG